MPDVSLTVRGQQPTPPYRAFGYVPHSGKTSGVHVICGAMGKYIVLWCFKLLKKRNFVRKKRLDL